MRRPVEYPRSISLTAACDALRLAEQMWRPDRVAALFGGDRAVIRRLLARTAARPVPTECHPRYCDFTRRATAQHPPA
jgi:hypothetical protein